MAKKYLFINHFPIPDENLKQKKVKDLPAVLHEIFYKSDINEFENPSSLPSLQQLYSSKECSKYEFIELSRKAILEIWHNYCGAFSYSFQSRDKDEIFVKLGIPDEVLLTQAHRTQYNLYMNPELEQNELVKDYMPVIPYDEFRLQDQPNLYQKYPDGSILKDIDRHRLCESLAHGHVNIQQCIKHGVLLDAFPIHDEKTVKEFRSQMCTYSLSTWLPLEKLRNYFGEQTAFYFLWVQFYTNWLLVLSIIGVIVWVIFRIYPERDKDGMSIRELVETLFAIVVTIWACMLNIYWQRTSNRQSLKWGVQNMQQRQVVRENFHGSLRKNPITGELEKFFPKKEKLKRQVLSSFTTFFMIGVVIVMTFSLFIYRAILTKSKDQGWGPMICAILNSIQIYGMNVVYDKLADVLNDWENHKTYSDFQNAIIVKKVAYQFINYYISLFYVAFVKQYQEGCDHNDCMSELNYNLWVMFALNMIFNFVEIGVPIIKKSRNLSSEEAKIKQMKQKNESEVRLSMSYEELQGKYDSIELLGEYLELVMNFGYIIFFAVAFPLGPLIYWLFNILELKGDSYKFLYLSKRPYPRAGSGIGVWTDVMSFLAVVSIITNTGILIFTSNVFNTNQDSMWSTFIVIEHALLLAVILLLNYYPMSSDELDSIRKRHEILKNVYFYKCVTEGGNARTIGKRFDISYEVHFDNE